MAQPSAYGDIFLAGTPALDRTAALLYQEQKQRQAKAQQENAAADAQMQKEFANVRSADVPDVINAWGKYKTLKKQLLFDKSLQNDPKKYAQVQQQANEALADTHSTINGSKEYKDILKGVNQAHGTHPDNFVDNYGELVSAAQNTPLKQLKTHKLGDLSNMDAFMYKGPDQDFSKIFSGAAGQPKQVYSDEAPVDKVGLQTKITPYLFGSTPKQYAESVVGALGTHKAAKAASFLWNHVSQSERDQVNQDFAQIPIEKWKKAGMQAPQDLPTNTGNDAVDFANYQAKKYFIANEPKEGMPQYKTNDAKKFQMETQRQQQMESIRHANAKDLIDYKKKIDPNDTQLNDTWANTYRDKVFEDAQKEPLVAISETTQSGKKMYGHRVPLNKVLVDALTIGKDAPVRVYVTDDNKILPIYLYYDEKGNPLKTPKGSAINEDLSRPISDVQFSVNLGAKNATGKAKTKEIRAALSGGTSPSPSTGGSWKDRAKKVQ